MIRHPGRLSPAANLNSASSRRRRFTELLADERDSREVEVVVVDVEGIGTDQTRRQLEVGVVRTDGDDRTCWRRHLVLADLDVLRDGDCLTFVDHPEPVALFGPAV